MNHKWQYILVLSLFAPLLNACADTNKDYTKSKYYVDKAAFSKGRPCAEVLFKCLPESENKAWQQIDANDKTLIENYQATKKELSDRQQVIEADDTMKITKSMMESFERIEHKRFIEKQAEDLEKEFPGFWRDVPKPVRYRWIKRAISKAKKYGYYDTEATESIQMIELCARIGLDFDLDPKWKTITNFISMPKGPSRGHAGEAARYIDFTIFEKDYLGEDKITDWMLRTPLQYLPYPKRKLPSIND